MNARIRFRTDVTPRRRRKPVPEEKKLKGDKKIGEKLIEVAKGIWIYSRRKASELRQEYKERKEQELNALKSKGNTPEYKRAAYLKHKSKKSKRFDEE